MRMMLMSNKNKYFTIIFTLYCMGSLWVIMSLSGCDQSIKNIPSASTLAGGQVTLLWNEIPDVIAYNVYVSESPGVTTLSGFKIRDVTNPFKVIHLEIGKTYYFIVTVVDESGESEESKELSYTAVEDKTGLIYFRNLFDKSAIDEKSSVPAEQKKI